MNILDNPDKLPGRRISRAEALRISREILERAERERQEIAEAEAARWEEDMEIPEQLLALLERLAPNSP